MLIGDISAELVIVILLLCAAGAWAVLAGLGCGRLCVARGLRHQKAVCARCGHGADFKAYEACPECGVRYDHAGVVTRVTAIRMAPPLWVIALLVLPVMAPVIVLLNSIVVPGFHEIAFGVAGEPRRYNYNTRFRPLDGFDEKARRLKPEYRFTISIDLVADSENPGPPVFGTIWLRMAGDSVNEYDIEYDIESTYWRMSDPSGAVARSDAGIESAVEALFRASGADSLWVGSKDELRKAHEYAHEATTTISPDFNPWTPDKVTEYGLIEGGGGGGSEPLPIALLIRLTAGFISVGLPLTVLAFALLRIRAYQQRSLRLTVARNREAESQR